MGRPAVREALRTLEQAGVLEFQKGTKGGAFIRDGNPAMLTQSLHDLLLVGRVSVENLAEARSLICGVVVEVACRRGTDVDFDEIEKNIQAIEAAHDLYQRGEEGVRFFRLIAEATHNEVLVILTNALSDILRSLMDKNGRIARPELVPLRRDLLKRMRTRDVESARKSLLRYMTKLHAPLLLEQEESASTPDRSMQVSKPRASLSRRARQVSTQSLAASGTVSK